MPLGENLATQAYSLGLCVCVNLYWQKQVKYVKVVQVKIFKKYLVGIVSRASFPPTSTDTLPFRYQLIKNLNLFN
ncbi:uncharacterized protein TrAFT101_009470 [Trichoderma asperellum]|uniref:uncharacterized protein n=1 Tax=Trichoderma asperellum TaxID=101201 RepID=UPI00331CA544|nr:hypothetical protein TrAFT101_009470 [Trichoderma asperellum]